MTQLPDFLELDADNEVRIRDHRIRLIDVAARYAEGHSPETILLDHYPTLSLPIIHKTIAFYLENQAEVSSLIAENTAAMVELETKTTRVGPTVDELRRRMSRADTEQMLLRRMDAPDVGAMADADFEKIRDRTRRRI
jgi:uncharacterized protein (DUF433 family)